MGSSKLPLPKFSTNKFDEVADDGQNVVGRVDGRIRSYPHVRGQWTTFIFSEVPDDSLISLTDYINSLDSEIKLVENIHVSLVRSHYALSFHQITPFISSLRDKLSNCPAFDVYLSTFKLFTNDESTRSFICLCEPKLMVDSLNSRTSRLVLDIINKTLDDFHAKVKPTQLGDKQSTNDDNLTIDDFTFHTSIAWCLPSAADVAAKLMVNLDQILDEPIKVHIDTIKINTGNISHSISLNYKQ